MIPATGTWSVDGHASSVDFTIRHLGVATVRGSFSSFAGRIDLTHAGVCVDGRVDVASVDTGDPIRDRRLRAEFFDADDFPEIGFRAATSLPANGRWQLEGDLTIRSVTRPVELHAVAEPCSDGSLRVRAEGRLRRSEFGLDWEPLRTAGGLLVADHVRLLVDVVLRPVVNA